MFLVTGPTASGKTTTAYALLHELADENRHIVTIEDPVEYESRGSTRFRSTSVTGSISAEGLRTILRLDPDHALIRNARSRCSAYSGVRGGGRSCDPGHDARPGCR